MNMIELEKKLFAAARRVRPSEAVPYLFEKRIMARIGGSVALDFWLAWERALWKATGPCIAITLLLSAWTWYSTLESGANDTFAAELETTVMAPLTVNLAEIW